MKSKLVIIPLGLCALAGIIYLLTAAPFMLWLDSLDFAAASVSLGINNPPAPLYVFVAHFFTLLPFGSVIFRLQIFSALSAAVTLFLVFLLIIDLSGKAEQLKNEISTTLAGIFGVLTLAFSYEFWSQAENVEKFIFMCFLEAIILYLATKILKSEKFSKLFYLLAFVFGLATGTDPVILSIFPAILLILWYVRKQLNFKNSY